MCGIVGMISQAPIDPARIVAMRDTMLHRGPDDAGLWQSADGRVALAHRRLAIVDLSPGGHQPMSDAAGQLWIVFNGEIYNHVALRSELESLGHRFRSTSDTEVILAAYRQWGDDCLSRLNGMFAFALYDVPQRRLFMARDRAGEKPLFYRQQAGGLAFASELKALMADPDCPRRLDRESLDQYLAFGYVTGERSILSGISKLPQGHALTYDVAENRLRVWPYWQLPEHEPAAVVDEHLVDELEALLLDSVRLRLQADVPVGVMLSGGLDSSLVAAMAARAASGPIRTFTISFPEHKGYDEAPFARLVARHFSTDHIEMPAEPATVDLLPQLARQYDEPLADSSMIPTYLVSRLIRQHATVALGGDGGDELFGGYRHYSWLARQRQARKALPLPVRRLISRAADSLPVGTRGRNHLTSLRDELPRSIAHVNLYFDQATRRRLLGGSPRGRSNEPSHAEALKMGLCRTGDSVLQQATRVDFQTYLVDDILVKVDRASMLPSLEARAPFLDPRIIELAFGRVPDRLRAQGGQRKILLRLLGARHLPRELDLKRKQGFTLPLDAWFAGDWGRTMREVLTDQGQQLFDRQVIEELLARQQRGYANMHRLFALTMLELWRREYRIAVA